MVITECVKVIPAPNHRIGLVIFKRSIHLAHQFITNLLYTHTHTNLFDPSPVSLLFVSVISNQPTDRDSFHYRARIKVIFARTQSNCCRKPAAPFDLLSAQKNPILPVCMCLSPYGPCMKYISPLPLCVCDRLVYTE